VQSAVLGNGMVECYEQNNLQHRDLDPR